MKHQNTRWFLSLLSAFLVIILASCGSSPRAADSRGSQTLSNQERLYVLDSSGSQRQIFAYYPGSPATPMSLADGLFSFDHQRIYSATAHNGQTLIKVQDTRTGQTIRQFLVPGTYSTYDQTYTRAILSGDGQWLAMREQGKIDTQTKIVIVDTQAGKLYKSINLNGYFDVDAISPDGNALYLLSRVDPTTGDYRVRLYNVNTSSLVEGFVIDKTAPDDNMTGIALTRQMPANGQTAYTLYTNKERNKAFVHILPLTGEPFARCLDLPVGTNPALLRSYSLVLSPDEKTLYAINSALGSITSINVSADQVFADTIIATSQFASAATTGKNASALYNGAVFSADQRMIYAVSTRGILALNVANLKLQHTYAVGQSFTSIALSTDGKTLYAVSPESGMTQLNILSGQFQRVLTSPVSKPSAIVWVTR